MFAFAFVWPWIGLGAAGLLLILLTTNALRSDRAVTRWRDMTWLTWADTCAYLVHQFEEHCIDAQGTAYAFRGTMCAQLGLGDPKTCPVPYSFITVVNVCLVWVAGPLSALLATRERSQQAVALHVPEDDLQVLVHRRVLDQRTDGALARM